MIRTKNFKKPGNTQKIREVFSRVDCNSCGKCCKVGGMLHIGNDERNYMKICSEIAKQKIPYSLNKKNGRLDIQTEDSDGYYCWFSPSDGKNCGIYEYRPRICSVFPFIRGGIEVEDSESGRTEDIIHLVRFCPPLEKLRSENILFILLSDIVPGIKRKLHEFEGSRENFVQYILEITQEFDFEMDFVKVIGSSFESLLDSIRRRENRTAAKTKNTQFIIEDSDIIFPIV